MATELVEVINTDATIVAISNSVILTSVYSTTIEAGTLGSENSVRWESQNKISMAAGASLQVSAYYSGLTIASIIVANGSAFTQADKGLVITAKLSGDGSTASQAGLVRSELGLSPLNDGSTPVGFGTIGVNSNSNQTFEIKALWGATSSSNSFTYYYSSLELLSFIADEPLPPLDEPTLILYLDSKLNKLRYDLRKDAYFYAPLVDDLVFYGYGEVTFTRASTSTATWRDGAAHSVGVDEPRFEYSGDTFLGLAINTGTEILNYSVANGLTSSSTLCWLQDNTFKNTPTDTNPFSAAGSYNGTSGVHISQFVKFNRVLTASEISEVQTALL